MTEEHTGPARQWIAVGNDGRPVGVARSGSAAYAAAYARGLDPVAAAPVAAAVAARAGRALQALDPPFGPGPARPAHWIVVDAAGRPVGVGRSASLAFTAAYARGRDDARGPAPVTAAVAGKVRRALQALDRAVGCVAMHGPGRRRAGVVHRRLGCVHRLGLGSMRMLCRVCTECERRDPTLEAVGHTVYFGVARGLGPLAGCDHPGCGPRRPARDLVRVVPRRSPDGERLLAEYGGLPDVQVDGVSSTLAVLPADSTGFVLAQYVSPEHRGEIMLAGGIVVVVAGILLRAGYAVRRRPAGSRFGFRPGGAS